MKIKNLAIIAGSGKLPEYAVDEALKRNLNFQVYLLDEENGEFTDFLNARSILFETVSIGRFDELLKKLKNGAIGHALIIGKIPKDKLFKGIKFNLKTLSLLKKIRNWNDGSIFNLIASEFANAGVAILKQDDFLKSMLLDAGIYSRKKPSKSDLESIHYGMDYAKKIAALDIGQTVVVANKTLLSVEAIEGTNEAIKRGGLYAHNKTAIVCKAMRKNQDTRFDVPTVGVETIEIMYKNGCTILAVEAQHTFVVDYENVFKKIDQFKMVFVVM